MRRGATRGFALRRPWLLHLICWGCGVTQASSQTILGVVVAVPVLSQVVPLGTVVEKRLAENYV